MRRTAAVGRLLATMRAGGNTAVAMRFASSSLLCRGGWRTAAAAAAAAPGTLLQQAFVVPLPLAIVRTFAVSQQAPATKTSSFLDRREVQERVVSVVKNYDKVDKSKVTATAHFNKDLGLDSLDTVEVLMSIEDEFKIEIPDPDAEKISSVAETIDYIARLPTAS